MFERGDRRAWPTSPHGDPGDEAGRYCTLPTVEPRPAGGFGNLIVLGGKKKKEKKRQKGKNKNKRKATLKVKRISVKFNRNNFFFFIVGNGHLILS